MNRWYGGAGWKTLGGVLLNDGTGDYADLIRPHFEPGSIPMADYAVEADVSVTRWTGLNFGIEVRADEHGARYSAGIESGRAAVWDPADKIVEGKGFESSGDWHTYRVEIIGNVITLLIDGEVFAQVRDNKYLEGGRVGLWSNGVQLETRSFKIFPL